MVAVADAIAGTAHDTMPSDNRGVVVSNKLEMGHWEFIKKRRNLIRQTWLQVNFVPGVPTYSPTTNTTLAGLDPWNMIEKLGIWQ